MDATHVNRHHGGKKKMRFLSDSQDINIPEDTGKGEPLLQQDVHVGAPLVSAPISGTAGTKLRARSCLAAPLPPFLQLCTQTHEWLMMPSRGGGLTLAPNQSPPSCGHPVWMCYQPVWGMTGRQERIKKSYKEEKEDGSASWLFHCTCKQAKKKCIETLNNNFIHPYRSFLWGVLSIFWL